jgi:UDP-glucose 4-epimerase
MTRRDCLLPVTSAALPRGEVLVTGGAGFLGSHLVDALLAAGRAVHVLDDLSSGSLRNLEAWRDERRLRVTIASAEDPAVAAAACAGAGCAFHLAGAVGVQRLAADPLAVMRRNLRCTEVMLEAASAVCVPILVASSSEVYGQGPVPFRESDPVRPGTPDGPRGGYACAKAMGEWLALGHARQRGLPAVVVRLFNAVGARQSPAYGMVLPRFVAQARAGAPITVFGDGTQTRCFAAAGEVVAALIALLGTDDAHGQVINVGSDREVTVRELAELVRRTSGSRSEIVHVPLSSAFPRGFIDPVRRVPCLDRLRRLIGWTPERPIETIVADLLGGAPVRMEETGGGQDLVATRPLARTDS